MSAFHRQLLSRETTSEAPHAWLARLHAPDEGRSLAEGAAQAGRRSRFRNGYQVPLHSDPTGGVGAAFRRQGHVDGHGFAGKAAEHRAEPSRYAQFTAPRAYADASRYRHMLHHLRSRPA